MSWFGFLFCFKKPKSMMKKPSKTKQADSDSMDTENWLSGLKEDPLKNDPPQANGQNNIQVCFLL